MSSEHALALLKESNYFQDVSEELQRELSELMVPVDVKDGHLFFTEGSEISSIIILESGLLQRTKLSSDTPQQISDLKTSIRDLPRHKRSNTLAMHSVLVDKIYGRGRVTGLLHNFSPSGSSNAFATVTAAADTKAWLLPGEDFRQVISQNPHFALEIMSTLSQELRQGNKSLRALIERTKGQSSHQDGDDDDTKKKKTCRVLCYDATSWVSDGFGAAVKDFNENNETYQIDMQFTTERLSEQTATFAAGYDAVCLFVNDTANADVLRTLSLLGVSMIAMRCAGFDRVDTKAARAYGMTVARVPAYSPYAVAEMAVALLMSVNRKIHKANNRVKMANFTLDAGLMGMDIYGKTVGIMGTGKIGQILVNIMVGFGAKVICYDVSESDPVKEAGASYVSKEECMGQADILFLMMPLLPATKHTINMDVLPKLKKGVILINTSRGGLVETKALLKGLADGIISGVGMDVYENEQQYFFQDWSARNIADLDLVALLGNNKVVLTAHQAFFTQEAVDAIVNVTIDNLKKFKEGKTMYEHPNTFLPPRK